MKTLFYPFLLFLFLSACTDRERQWQLTLLDTAERILPLNADSASRLLDSLPSPEALGDRDFARWCMLCGKATNYTHADKLLPGQWLRAQAWIEKHGSAEERAQALLFLGRAYAEDNEQDLAMQTYTHALQFAKEHQAYNIGGYICTYMADLYYLYDMSDEVRKKYAEAASLFSKASNHKSQAYALKNLAMEYAFIDSFSCANRIMSQVDSIAKRLDVQRLNYTIANAYANMYKAQGHYEQAETYFKKAIALDSRGGMEDTVGLAYTYLEAGKLPQARELADKMALHDSMDYCVNDIYYLLYNTEGNYEQALHYKEICFKIFDSLTTAHNKTKVASIEKKYNYLRMHKKNRKLENERLRLLIYCTSCLCLLVMGTAIFFYYRKKTKLKMLWQEEKLKNLDQERSEIAEQLTEAKHMLEIIKDNKQENARLQQKIELLSAKYRQLQIQRLNTSPIYKKFASLAQKKTPGCNKALITDKHWNLLVSEIGKSYPDFHTALYRQSPNLSNDEWHYCCLHVLGFDGNDEALLLGIMPASVWMKSSRIKQKLGYQASKEQKLYDILINDFLH